MPLPFIFSDESHEQNQNKIKISLNQSAQIQGFVLTLESKCHFTKLGAFEPILQDAELN